MTYVSKISDRLGEIQAEIDKGTPIPEIAVMVGMTTGGLRRALKRAGIHDFQCETAERRTIGTSNYQELRELALQGWTADQLAQRYGVDQETIRKHARKRDLQLQTGYRSLEDHPSWSGGTTKDRSGYTLVRVDPEGPYGYLIRAGNKYGGYAPEHRIRMHDKLGRRLLPGEVVHHIDGDKTNNNPDNLGLYRSNAEHLRETLSGHVPNWTPEGFARMKAPKPRLGRLS